MLNEHFNSRLSPMSFFNSSGDGGGGGGGEGDADGLEKLAETLGESGLDHHVSNDSSPVLMADEMDVDSFWTKEQLMMIENFPANGYLIMGMFVSIVGILGFVANGTILFIFSKFKRLRSPPANTFIMNLALSDLGASLLHSMAAYSNFEGRWAFGRLGCELYGMGVGFFGLVSILTFSAIACERCLVITCPTKSSGVLPDGRCKVSRAKAQKVCALIWLHCGVLCALPLFGWSSYVPEGLMTSCSWDYTTRSAANRAYYVLLLTTGFVLPVLVICASYGRIMASVVSHARQMVCVNKQSSAFRKLRRQTEIRTAQIVVTLIVVYLTAWTPYAVVTLIGQFGPADSPLTPIATAVPAYFAKTAVVLDPIVYGLSHPHFRTSLRHYLANAVAQHHKSSLTSTLQHQRAASHSKSIAAAVAAAANSAAGFHSTNGGGGGGGRASCSSYHSRGMAVYPSNACCVLRVCEPLTCPRLLAAAGISGLSAAAAGDGGGNKRRMLRTFRDIDAKNVSVNSMTASRAGGTFRNVGVGSGVMELCHSYVSVVSIPLDRSVGSMSTQNDTLTQGVARDGASASSSPGEKQTTPPSRQLQQQQVPQPALPKYKVRNGDFHSEYYAAQ